MTAKPKRSSRPRKRDAGAAVVPDGFYRDMVWNLRNGVIAITRDGRVAVMNEIAYRTLGLKARDADIGRHYSEVLKDAPDVCRIENDDCARRIAIVRTNDRDVPHVSGGRRSRRSHRVDR